FSLFPIVRSINKWTVRDIEKFSRMESKFLGEFSEFPMGHACMSLLFNIEQHFVERNLSIMVNSVCSQ
ncbi:hypothetical protein, partial [Streptococcus agalactiae]|uniref:hypothetical protein n=1 Tax=Streptococcus agalactiae TaxID=1311 RepID=UPI001A7E684B